MIGAGGWISEEQPIVERSRIEALANQLLLFLLEGLGGVERRANADEHRVRVSRQAARETTSEILKIEAIVDHDCRHSGAAIGAGNHDAIGRGIDYTCDIPHRIAPSGGPHVRALPAEDIAEAIDEVEIALLVEPHQIAGAKPGIALGEHVAQNLLFGFGRVGVALEAAAALIRSADAADGFAGLAARASNAKPAGIANGSAEFGVELHDDSRKAMREQRRNPADRARFSLDIVERKIALGCRVEFKHSRNRKARLKSLPDIAAQTVATGEPQPVRGFEFGWRRLQEIAAEFADILKQGAIEAHDVLPELAHGEFLREHDGSSRAQHAAGRDDTADGMIDRQAIIQAILRRRIGQPGEPIAPILDAAMADAGRLRQAGGARGV